MGRRTGRKRWGHGHGRAWPCPRAPSSLELGVDAHATVAVRMGLCSGGRSLAQQQVVQVKAPCSEVVVCTGSWYASQCETNLISPGVRRFVSPAAEEGTR